MAKINLELLVKTARAQAQLEKYKSAAERARLATEKAALQNQLLAKQIDRVGKESQQASTRLRGLAGAVQSFIGNLSANAVTAGFNALRTGLANGVDQAVTYEKALIAVARTADLTAEQQDELAKSISSLGKEIPLSAQELLRFSKIAGQLGIQGVDQITAFTETFAKLAVATDIQSEESAIAFTKILGLTDELGEDGVQNIEKLGNVLTALGNTTKTLETNIVSTGLEVGKALAPFGVASETVLAFSATLAESGVAAEAAGSSIQRIFQELIKASTEGGKDLQNYAIAAGVTAEEFKRLAKNSPEKAFTQLAKNIAQSNLTAGQQILLFERLGITQQRTQRSLLPLINNYKGLEKNIKTANKEAETGSALNREAAKAFNTLGSDLDRTKNAFNDASRAITAGFQPAISAAAGILTDLFKDIEESTALQALIVGLASASIGFVAVAAKAALATTTFAGVKVAAIAAWGAITAPVSLVIAGIGLVGAAIFILVKKWNTLLKLSNKYLGTSFKIAEQSKKTANEFENLKNKSENLTKATDEQTRAQEKQGDSGTKITELLKSNEKAKRDELKKTAELRKKIQEEERAAEQAVTEAQNLEFAARFGSNQAFNETRLQAVRDFYTEREKIEIEARLLGIENERLKQIEIDKILAEGITRRAQSQIKSAQEVADAIIAEDNKYLENQKQIKEEQDKLDKQREANRRSSLSTIATLQRSNSKELAFIGKAAGITQIAIDTPVAVSKAYAAFPPPFNFIAAAAVGAAMAAQASQIAGVNVGGFERGGVVPGSNFTGDNLTANVNSGEMILNRQQQAQLFQMANGQSQANAAQAPINITTKVMLDDQVVGESTSRWVANGGQLGEVQ
jgi:TP901 family phage tail tape measure protein